MRRLSPTRRALVAGLAIVQMAVPALVAIADAEAASRSAGAQVHIEDHTHRTCKAVHPDDCALCQFLSLLSPRCADPALVPAADRARPVDCANSSRLPTPVVRALQRTRAPPVG